MLIGRTILFSLLILTRLPAQTCSYAITPTSTLAPAAGGLVVAQILTTSGCTWSVAGLPAWIAVIGAASGTGSGLVALSVQPNSGSARSATVQVGGQNWTISQSAGAATQCSYSIAPPSRSIAAEGGRFGITITTGAGCSWSASKDAAWVTLSVSSGLGSATIEYSAAANTAATERRAAISVQGQTHTVVQAAVVANQPQLTDYAAVADFGTEVAPGSLVFLTGRNLPAEEISVSKPPIPTTLAGLSVEMTDAARTVKLPVYYVSPGILTVQLPYRITSPSVQVVAKTSTGSSAALSIPVSRRAPRLYGDSGVAVAYHADGSPVTDESPAKAGERISFDADGLGEVVPLIEPGTAPSGNRVNAAVTSTLGGRPAVVESAGLLDGYPGFYAIDIMVPSGLAAGKHEVLIQCEGASSQRGVVIPIASDWITLTEAAVPAAGGVVTAAGVEITVPAGSASTLALTRFEGATDSDDQRVSPVYSVSGITGPVTITMEKTAAGDSSTPVLVAIRDTESKQWGTQFVTATESGGKITFTLPGSDAAKSTRAATAPLPARTLLYYAVQGYSSANSRNGNFVVFYDKTFNFNWARGLANALEDARDLFQNHVRLDIQRRTRWPILVFVYKFKWYCGQNTNAEGEEGEPGSDKQGQQINMNSAYIRSDTEAERAKTIVAHELMHLFQNLYDPRPGTEIGPNAWLWMEEAMSTWTERAYNLMETSGKTADRKFIPPRVQDGGLWFFVRNGLSMDTGAPSAVGEHGYGAALFLEYLIAKMGGAPYLTALLEQMAVASNIGGSPKPQYTPLEAMKRTTPDVFASYWIEFSQKFMKGEIYDGVQFPSPVDFLTTRPPGNSPPPDYVFAGATAAATSFSREYPDLSAQIYRIRFTGADWTATSRVPIVVTPADPNVRIIVYANRGSTWRMLHDFAANAATQYITAIDVLAARQEDLFIMVSNANSNASGTGRMNITLRLGQESQWGLLSMAKPRFACVATSPEQQPIQRICPDELPRITITSKDLTLQWTGSRFTGKANLTGTNPDDSGTRTASGNYDAVAGTITDFQFTETIHSRNQARPNQIIDWTFSIKIPRLERAGTAAGIHSVPADAVASAIRSITFNMTETHAGFRDSTVTTQAAPGQPVVSQGINVLLMPPE